MGRFLALTILIIPGVIAGFGIKLMRDSLFQISNISFLPLALEFVLGIILFLAGLSFIAGFIFYRDKKNGKIPPKKQKDLQ
ncbi:DUF2627 domain-containing protein [Alkalihalobacillus trypoxylicola]|uniref:DUF2627 domain-containing protein n=1 Tax=Alkalihalobacillus trypoxylicola TaxID=519424 RepID=A0A161QI04_9BACI|nr:DUF2627 domain-containing protein [Alkalihalobacillus trypoxylicola]KYG29079.1 hypothetical protein AZF04_20275 [Alkalihalobacillus trypoxylicola]GAF63822.1 hypothetical protein BTS2_0714 [Bacillus sp. TS-2]